MGKHIDDLDGALDDRPLGLPDAEADDRERAWFAFVTEITDLLDGGEADWAADTLTGIQETVERTRLVTDAQRHAVANIARASSFRQPRWRWRR